MTDICLIFEVHQPPRLNRNFHRDIRSKRKIATEDLFDLYFDNGLNKYIFDRVSQRCYFPTNQVILEQIDMYKRQKKPFKVTYSLSGVFIDYCKRWNWDLLDSFRKLAETGCVEFLDQTYCHSLSSLYSMERTEFIEQVRMHRQTMKDLFNYEPKVFENTELLYNNAIAQTIKGLGYKGIMAEGVDRVLGWMSPNRVYRAKYSGLPILLRNYRLSDDIGFRFNSRWWEEWPLTADKYAAWLAAAVGDVINIFVDYETFGEHFGWETGIFEFLKWLPGEVNRRWNLSWSTPSEVIEHHDPVGEIDVHEYSTISWADMERDTSTWMSNWMQWTCYDALKELEHAVKETKDENLIRIWRYLQTSDHLYYMCIKGGGPGIVHSYFSPYKDPFQAFTTYFGILCEFQGRVMERLGRASIANRSLPE